MPSRRPPTRAQAEYAEYLNTPGWKERSAVHRGKGCAACGYDFFPIAVHHMTYENRGAEKPSDLVPLCTYCHRSVHVAARKGHMSLRDATRAVQMKGGSSQARRRAKAMIAQRRASAR